MRCCGMPRFGKLLASLVGTATLLALACSSPEKTVLCGTGSYAPLALPDPGPKGAGPRRLYLPDDGTVQDDQRRPLRLRGMNLRSIDDAKADDMVQSLGVNFVRMRIDFEPDTRDDADPSAFTAKFRGEVTSWITTLAAHRIWTLIEMRANDEVTNDPAFYAMTSPTFALYQRAWTWLATTFRDTDYVAGYGLLAEPSASRGNPAPMEVLTTFQEALMKSIDALDHATPFFVGTDFNYDTMQYRDDGYYDRHAAWRGRLVYEVNALVPKPWIQDGSTPSGVSSDRGSWPQLPAPQSFDLLITPAPSESFIVPRDLERIYAKRTEEPAGFTATMNADFLKWYLGYAHDFAVRHRVPMVVDQFGASFSAAGQLAYESALLDVVEGYGFHWARWSYDAGTQDRFVAADPTVCEMYRARARR